MKNIKLFTKQTDSLLSQILQSLTAHTTHFPEELNSSLYTNSIKYKAITKSTINHTFCTIKIDQFILFTFLKNIIIK